MGTMREDYTKLFDYSNPIKKEIFQQKMLGEGAVDHLPLFKALIKIGYNGFLSNECHAAVPDIERSKHDLIEIKNQLRIAEKI